MLVYMADSAHPTAQHSRTPSLGGAFDIGEIRQALGEWIGNYTSEGPLDCDVEDFIRFGILDCLFI